MNFILIIFNTGVKNEFVIPKKNTSSDKPFSPYIYVFKNLLTKIGIRMELIRTANMALNPTLVCSLL